MTRSRKPEVEIEQDESPFDQRRKQFSEWMDRAANFILRFDRFGWDILGVALMAFSLMTLLALVGLSQGQLMTGWINLLRRWFGWGSFITGIFIGMLGLVVLWRHFSSLRGSLLRNVLALEGMAFTMLALLSILGGHSLERADRGMDGGLVGWGLADLVNIILPMPFSTILFFILMGIFTFFGFDLQRILIPRFEKWLFEGLNEPGRVSADVASGVNLGDTANSERSLRDLGLAGSGNPALPVKRDERLPPYNLLMQDTNHAVDEEAIQITARRIEKTLEEFGIPASVTGYRVGPTVTQFAVEPGFVEKEGPDGVPVRQKVRVAQVSALSRDLALALSAERLRIESPVPGQSFIGIEVPNPKGSMVRLRPVMETEAFQRIHSALAIALGTDVSGQPVVADLARMPHLLIAGTTGSGKSVSIAALAVCLVMNNTPDDLRLAMLDPKMVELIRFNGLPHLLGKVETQADRMLGVLRWAQMEMDQRYRLLEAAHARDLDSYNHKMERKKQQTLPRIVVFIDELADLMMSEPEQTEHSLVRLAQMARAVGIHLVVATQRPSTDVVTGLIKANFPARISFSVASSVDSRVILDTSGAETLLGRGDMLFLNPELGSPMRAQGVMVTDQEISKILEFWRKMTPTPEGPPPWEEVMQTEDEGADGLVEAAIGVVRSAQRASTSLLQRRLRIGYPRAARLIDELEEMGVVGPAQAGGREREVLIGPEDADEEGDSLEEDN